MFLKTLLPLVTHASLLSCLGCWLLCYKKKCSSSPKMRPHSCSCASNSAPKQGPHLACPLPAPGHSLWPGISSSRSPDLRRPPTEVQSPPSLHSQSMITSWSLRLQTHLFHLTPSIRVTAPVSGTSGTISPSFSLPFPQGSKAGQCLWLAASNSLLSGLPHLLLFHTHS